MNYSPELQQLLELEIPVSPPAEIGFLEISETQSNELINSRLYAHFLNPDRNPKVAELFLETLINIIISKKPEKILSFQNYTCEVEVSLKSRMRIDILIKTKEQKPVQAIIIENKIYDQNNDPKKFIEYYDFIVTEDLNKVGIYLTLDKRTPNHSSFINITHSEWMEAIKKRGIPAGLELKEYVYLNDFFSTINNLTMSTEFNSEVEFFFKHNDKVLAAENTRIKARQFFLAQLEIAASELNCTVGDSNDYYKSFYFKNNINLFYGIYFRNFFDGNPNLEIGIGIYDLTTDIKTKIETLRRNNIYFTEPKIESKSEYIISQLKACPVSKESYRELPIVIEKFIVAEFSDLKRILEEQIL